MIKHRTLLVCALAAALLAGCARFVSVPPTQPREIAGVLRVDPRIQWSALSDGSRETWTIDGTALEAISFLTKIGDGDTLLSAAVEKKGAPTYRKGMTAPDVADFFQATLFWLEYSQIETKNLRPAAIGEARGFQFEYSALDKNGLAKRGIVLGLIDEEDQLNLVIYEAAAEHYYDTYRDEAEAVFRSIEKI